MQLHEPVLAGLAGAQLVYVDDVRHRAGNAQGFGANLVRQLVVHQNLNRIQSDTYRAVANEERNAQTK